MWDEIQPVVLFTAVNRQQGVFIWPVRLPKGEGRTDRFMESDMVAAKEAEQKWTRRYWLPDVGMHKVLAAPNLTDKPVWPDISFQELLKIAFKNSFIHDQNHPVIRRLRGEG